EALELERGALEVGQEHELTAIRQLELERVQLAHLTGDGVGDPRPQELVRLAPELLVLVAAVAGDAVHQTTPIPLQHAPLDVPGPPPEWLGFDFFYGKGRSKVTTGRARWTLHPRPL